MSYSKYNLEVISHHPAFEKKSLRKYSVDGIETVGAWGNEPFELRFKNNTYSRIQVKFSIDGTDIMTGELASTEPSSKMWIVEPYSTISLKAWPETNNGGARFVFTTGEKGVAANTHGDMSNRGIIAAAVFVEGHVEPPVLYVPFIFNNNYDYRCCDSDSRIARRSKMYQSYTLSNTGNNMKSTAINTVYNSNTFNMCDASDSISCNVASAAAAGTETLELKSEASVGAGEYVNQNITYVAGLKKPVFTETVRVRYLWWDDLQAKLKSQAQVEAQPSGFPADKKNINLGSTPRIQSTGVFRRSAEVEYSRI